MHECTNARMHECTNARAQNLTEALLLRVSAGVRETDGRGQIVNDCSVVAVY
jgi:hypothetical protein